MAQRNRALITGVTGQDGSYLADFLLEKNYEVFGLVRRTSKPHTDNISHLIDNPNFHIIYGDLTDQGSINRAVLESTPDEVYNLAAQSFVGGSWDYPVSTADITGLGPLRLLEALRQFNPKARFYQASSSEMYGNRGGMLDENSPLSPRSPYGSAKAFAHYTTINYRESYGIHASCGILFNHESPRRGIEFVTRKITDGVAKITLGKEKKLKLGNIQAKRDWGDARDYVRAMWLMLQQPTPDVYVIATGQSYSIKNFLGLAFNEAGVATGAIYGNNWEQYIEIDPAFNRPADIDVLIGDAAKAREILGWKPEISLKQMVKDMLKADMERNS
jgi:GDPmannose 4,6-dehydratase